jgi:DNA repair exonuclease SbcCD nuclease subunit
VKVLFSADLHIKLGQKNVPRDFQKARYKMLFKKLNAIQADIHILGGDIFDKSPNPEEVSLFFDFIQDVNIPTFIYDGNHCATRKGQTFLVFFIEACRNINNLVTVIDGITEIEGIDIIPYTDLKTFNPSNFHNDILCTHVRGSIPPHVIPEVDLELFSRWRTVLAGDLHAYENSQLNILYPGSPLAISFHRNPVKNGVIIFDTETHEHEWIDLGLPQLIRKTVDNEKDIVKTAYDHTIYEVTGNILDLSGIDTSSDLIDKKIIRKKTDSTLDLSNKSIQEELELYLREVIKLDATDITDTMRVFNDYDKGINVG